MILKFFKIFFKPKPKIAIVKTGDKYYIRRKCGYGYEYLYTKKNDNFWWTSAFKENGAFNTLEETENRWKIYNGETTPSNKFKEEILKPLV